MTALADADVQRFLATKQVAVLATLQADGAPLAMPMWFLHDPSTLTMISVENTQKVRNLRRDPRVCVVAEAASESGEIRGVTITGGIEFLEDGPDEGRSSSASMPNTPVSRSCGAAERCPPIA